MECTIQAQRRQNDVHYSVSWSALRKADRWTIAKSVPAVGGVFEIYWMDERHKLRLFWIGSARFGGLRSELRRLTDAELADNAASAAILENREIWYRYSMTDSAKDMADVVWFFRAGYFPERPGTEHSGRYDKIYLTESSPDDLHWTD